MSATPDITHKQPSISPERRLTPPEGMGKRDWFLNTATSLFSTIRDGFSMGERQVEVLESPPEEVIEVEELDEDLYYCWDVMDCREKHLKQTLMEFPKGALSDTDSNGASSPSGSNSPMQGPVAFNLAEQLERLQNSRNEIVDKSRAILKYEMTIYALKSNEDEQHPDELKSAQAIIRHIEEEINELHNQIKQEKAIFESAFALLDESSKNNLRNAIKHPLSIELNPAEDIDPVSETIRFMKTRLVLPIEENLPPAEELRHEFARDVWRTSMFLIDSEGNKHVISQHQNENKTYGQIFREPNHSEYTYDQALDLAIEQNPKKREQIEELRSENTDTAGRNTRMFLEAFLEEEQVTEPEKHKIYSEFYQRTLGCITLENVGGIHFERANDQNLSAKERFSHLVQASYKSGLPIPMPPQDPELLELWEEASDDFDPNSLTKTKVHTLDLQKKTVVCDYMISAPDVFTEGQRKVYYYHIEYDIQTGVKTVEERYPMTFPNPKELLETSSPLPYNV